MTYTELYDRIDRIFDLWCDGARPESEHEDGKNDYDEMTDILNYVRKLAEKE